MDDLDQLLQEAYHSYQIYLECTQLIDGNLHISLLKWPDIAQAAIAWGKSIKIGNQGDIINAMSTLRSDLITAMISPVEVIYQSAYVRIQKITGISPSIKIDHTTRISNPILYKNDMIKYINNMFKTLETFSEVKYPKIRGRNESFS